MPGGAFFGSLTRLHQMMGNLFYRRVQPSEIEGMTFSTMAYWNEWHEILAKAEKEVLNA